MKSFCPFISNETIKREPSPWNCKDCCFYVFEHASRKNYCAILLAAERASNIAEVVIKSKTV